MNVDRADLDAIARRRFLEVRRGSRRDSRSGHRVGSEACHRRRDLEGRLRHCGARSDRGSRRWRRGTPGGLRSKRGPWNFRRGSGNSSCGERRRSNLAVGWIDRLQPNGDRTGGAHLNLRFECRVSPRSSPIDARPQLCRCHSRVPGLRGLCGTARGQFRSLRLHNPSRRDLRCRPWRRRNRHRGPRRNRRHGGRGRRGNRCRGDRRRRQVLHRAALRERTCQRPHRNPSRLEQRNSHRPDAGHASQIGNPSHQAVASAPRSISA
jgi:hypothetical protein